MTLRNRNKGKVMYKLKNIKLLGELALCPVIAERK